MSKAENIEFVQATAKISPALLEKAGITKPIKVTVIERVLSGETKEDAQRRAQERAKEWSNWRESNHV